VYVYVDQCVFLSYRINEISRFSSFLFNSIQFVSFHFISFHFISFHFIRQLVCLLSQLDTAPTVGFSSIDPSLTPIPTTVYASFCFQKIYIKKNVLYYVPSIANCIANFNSSLYSLFKRFLGTFNVFISR
jgi:hypothetical protein